MGQLASGVKHDVAEGCLTISIPEKITGPYLTVLSIVLSASVYGILQILLQGIHDVSVLASVVGGLGLFVVVALLGRPRRETVILDAQGIRVSRAIRYHRKLPLALIAGFEIRRATLYEEAKMGACPWYMAFSHGGNYLFVTSTTSETLRPLEYGTRQFVQIIGGTMIGKLLMGRLAEGSDDDLIIALHARGEALSAIQNLLADHLEALRRSASANGSATGGSEGGHVKTSSEAERLNGERDQRD
jgi:hypothetical protein